jgi:integrase
MRYSKDDIRYWQQSPAVFKRITGTRELAKDWSVRIMHDGRREAFTLDTPNRENAAAKAREIYRYLVATGWESTLGKYKPANATATKHSGIRTVGDFLKTLELTADIKPKTLEGYAIAFRSIVASIEGISGGGRGGSKDSSLKWREKVHAIKLSKITPAKVAEWKKSFLAKYPADPASQRRARISVNSLIRRAKSLYAPKYLKHLLPVGGSPFQGISFEKKPSQRYRSSLNPFNLIEAANRDLAGKEPELFKIFCLALMAGLRRGEIDLLEWSAFKWDQGVIRIEPTKFLEVKSEYSIGDIEVDHELIEMFREMKANTLGPFVVQSPSHVQPRPGATFEHYRCTSLFEKLIAWLRSQGVQTSRPIHTLRKEFGSQLADQHGIYVASRMLRHADIQVTAAHYLDKRSRKTVGLGSLLKKSASSADLPEPEQKIEGSF